MKKGIALLLAVVMLLSLAACGKTGPSGNSGNTEQPSKYSYDTGSLESMLTFIKATGETAGTDTTNQAETLIEKLGDSYTTYSSNKTEVTAFFASAQTRSAELYAAFQACSIDYFKCVAKQGLDDYDTWDELNPWWFDYTYDYEENLERTNVDECLEGDSRCFTDLVAMSYPTEDRSRLFANAMMDGNEEMFASSAMQKKLRCICIAIREAYDYQEYTEIFTWEQYLNRPIAPSS